MGTILIASVWLAGMGPQLNVQPFADAQACRFALSRTEFIMQEQARTNLVAPHNNTRIERSDDRSRAVLRTPVGREIARFECVQVE